MHVMVLYFSPLAFVFAAYDATPTFWHPPLLFGGCSRGSDVRSDFSLNSVTLLFILLLYLQDSVGGSRLHPPPMARRACRIGR